MVEEPCFLRTKKERIHKSSFYSIAFSFQKSKPFFQFFSCFFSLSPRYPKTSTSRILSSVSNTLWAPRVSFEIRHLRRLRLERSRESLSRSWWLAQSYPAHVAAKKIRSLLRPPFSTILTLLQYLSLKYSSASPPSSVSLSSRSISSHNQLQTL